MLRSLYSGVSGLRNHQQKMDVIGNNIANVNTAGFKKGRTDFKDMLSQTLQDAAAPSLTKGGTNPAQIGLGVTMGSIETIMTQGAAQTTGKNTDLMIQGDGFFVVNNGGKLLYTRAGAFDLDASGNLVDPSTGAFVETYSFGSPTSLNPPVQTQDLTALKSVQLVKGAAFPGLAPGDPLTGYTLDTFSIDKSGTINGVYTKPDGSTAVVRIAQVAIANFPNVAGLSKEGNSYYANTNNSGAASIGVAGTSGRGDIIPGGLEMSNVDLSEEFTDMIITQRGFQANSRVITVSDTLLEELINLKR